MTAAARDLNDRCNERDDLIAVFNRLKDSNANNLMDQTKLVGDIMRNVKLWMELVDKL